MTRLTISTQPLSKNLDLGAYQYATQSYTFCFYVSGHGWGHATRACQLVSDLLALPAKHTVYMVSNASDFIFQNALKAGAIYRHSLIDAGVVQPLAYTVDREETIKHLVEFIERRPVTINKEVEWLKSVGADCVLCDAPFLPCAAASAAGLPSAIISNFTFDEVYRGLCEGDELDNMIHEMLQTVIKDYKKADLLIRLPGAIRIPSFDDNETVVPQTPTLTTHFDQPQQQRSIVNGKLHLPSVSTSPIRSYDPTVRQRLIIDIPLVFRKYRTPRDQVLEDILHIPPEIHKTHKIILLSFGGQILGKEGWGDPLPEGWICVVCGTPDSLQLQEGFYRAPRDAYIPDLTNAVDVVIGKLGYGTCSECVGHAKPFIYVPRPQFIEELGLKRLMETQGSCVELPREDFEGGRWRDYILKAAQLPGQCEEWRRVGHDGGEVAAKLCEAFVTERKQQVASNGYTDGSVFGLGLGLVSFANAEKLAEVAEVDEELEAVLHQLRWQSSPIPYTNVLGCLAALDDLVAASYLRDTTVDENYGIVDHVHRQDLDQVRDDALAVLFRVVRGVELTLPPDLQETEQAIYTLQERAAALTAHLSGRGASGAITRVWRFPRRKGDVHGNAIEVSIHEPGYVGDDLGFKTWGAAPFLGRKLVQDSVIADISSCRILELGTGTGLVGLVCAKLGANTVILTDYHPNVLVNVAKNVSLNLVREPVTRIGVVKLDWRDVRHSRTDVHGALKEPFDVVIGSDLLYEIEHAQLIPLVTKKHLKKGRKCHFLVPLRCSHQEEVRVFEAEMAKAGFKAVHTEEMEREEDGKTMRYRYWEWIQMDD
ncbi:hypothetical protein BZG36_00819 [Bifiguratus adelaidae]|uniref:Uncharacterized protein n=1 Tax=Bifiguratus adelaidae TaxID=1938954 RepID=A0A261Y6H9_9FUNG|nr:hypothetical protein BZG36_00819 [Bifiguratus adelaidae]